MKKIITTRKNGSKRVQLDFSDEKTQTQQQYKQECDINSVLENYRKAGTPLPNPQFAEQIVDLTSYTDFQDSMNLIVEAQTMFNSLPAVLRKKMGNDPSNLPEYLQDNAEEAIKFGLMTKKEAPTQTPKNDDKTTIKGDPSIEPPLS